MNVVGPEPLPPLGGVAASTLAPAPPLPTVTLYVWVGVTWQVSCANSPPPPAFGELPPPAGPVHDGTTVVTPAGHVQIPLALNPLDEVFDPMDAVPITPVNVAPLSTGSAPAPGKSAF